MYITPKTVKGASHTFRSSKEKVSNDRIMLCLEGAAKYRDFVNHDGNGVATGTNTLARAESHDGYHTRIDTTNYVPR